MLKYLANDLRLCIVLVGTADAPLALQSDAQMNSQFRPFELTRWQANQALTQHERLLFTPQRERMPCMVMHSESNIGKTLIVKKLLREHPSAFDTVAGVERRQVISMQMPATPEQHRFYSALLFELGVPHRASARLSVLERLARELLRRIEPRMLIVDEVHHLLAGGHREQRASLNLLKYLACPCLGEKHSEWHLDTLMFRS